MSARIDAVAVGIPARDEATRIEACIEALASAAGEIDRPTIVVVAADDCHDDTAFRADSALLRARHRGLDGMVINTAHRTAGGARSAAIDAALERTARDPARVWVATTDADTVVDRSWLATHLAWANSGIDGIAGLVGVAWEGGPEDLADRYRASIVRGGVGVGHAHVHGANLGLRADRWVAVGGCGPGAVGEDHELWTRLRTSGALLLGVDDLLVTTSGRLYGRAPGGFADYLHDLFIKDDDG